MLFTKFSLSLSPEPNNKSTDEWAIVSVLEHCVTAAASPNYVILRVPLIGLIYYILVIYTYQILPESRQIPFL